MLITVNSADAGRYDYLMILRGLSAIAVVFCHMPFELHRWIGINYLDWIFDPFGYIPVLIFFSLSGYLITLGFITGRHCPETFNGVTIYYRSRLYRILPLYYFSIIFCALVYFDSTLEFPKRVAKLFIFTENYKPETGIIFNHVYWTMPIEMLYFFLAPLIYVLVRKGIIILGLWKFLFLVLMCFGLVAAVIFSVLPFDSGGYKVPRKQWSLLSRFDFIYNLWAFSLGGVAAFIVKEKGYRSFFLQNRRLIKYLCVATITIATAYCTLVGINQLNHDFLSFFIAFGLLPSMGLFVLGVAILNETQAPKPRAYFNIFVYVGLLSYGIYLFHMPISSLLVMVFGELKLAVTDEWFSLSVLFVTIVFSHFTYQYIELPFLKRRHSVESRAARKI